MRGLVLSSTLGALVVAACGPGADTTETAAMETPGAVAPGPEAPPSPEPAPEPASQTPAQFAAVDGARIAAADDEPGQWLTVGRDYG